MCDIQPNYGDYSKVTLAELIDEGRKYVFVCRGRRLMVCVEDHPLKFLLGSLSNNPEELPPAVIPPDVPNEQLDEFCIELSLAHELVKDKQEWLDIQMSSLRRSNLNDKVTIKAVDEDTIWLSNGWGNDIVLDTDQQLAVYRAIADHQFLERRADCPQCGKLLDCDWYCDDCDLSVEPGLFIRNPEQE